MERVPNPTIAIRQPAVMTTAGVRQEPGTIDVSGTVMMVLSN